MHINHISMIEVAVKDESSVFDMPLSPKISTLDSIPPRLTLNNQTIPIKLDSIYARHIFLVITTSLESEWFHSLNKITKRGYVCSLKVFVPWLNQTHILEQSRYSLLKEFESYRVNQSRVKPQSTGLKHILILLNEGVYAAHIGNETTTYITRLTKNTSLSIFHKPEPDSLNKYFRSTNWLRDAVGEANFLKLESPRRLIDSFSITIASTLLFIIQQKILAKKRLNSTSIFIDEDTLSKRAKNQFYCGNLFINLCQFDMHGQPIDNLTELILLDITHEKNHSKLFPIWDLHKGNETPIYNHKLNSRQIFTKPDIFHSESWEYPSHIEQILFGWLCAWQTIQPQDIFKLKSSDFVIARNQLGRPVSVQSSYYKGRSARIQEPPMLDARVIEAEAIISYIQQLPENSRLFSKEIHRPIHLSFGKNSISEKLGLLLSLKSNCDQISKNIEMRQSSSLFSKAYLALYKERDYSFSKWLNQQKNHKNSDLNKSAYITQTERPLPNLIFSLSGIKNSAVYARSDVYRDNDLINQNSHTSLTEKTSYLTDANKDWVNQNGRITRLVLNDIENYVYKPNLNAALAKSHELQLRTRVVDILSSGVSDTSNIKIDTLGQLLDFKEINYGELDFEPDDIIVLDTEETVVNMLHYVNEAERQRIKLTNYALPFFERTIIPTVEWMHVLMQERLSPNVVRIGKINYEKIREILPPLFVNELQGGVGS